MFQQVVRARTLFPDCFQPCPRSSKGIFMGQNEKNRRSLSLDAFDQKVAAEKLHQLSDDGKSQSCPLITPGHGPFHLVKRFKNSCDIFVGDSYPRIEDREQSLYFEIRTALDLFNLNADISLVRKFYCIPHKIEQYLPEPCLVGNKPSKASGDRWKR